MPFDTNWPPDHGELDGAPFRAQFNGLKALLDAQQSQLVALQNQLAQFAPIVPVLARDSGGNWTLAYTQPPPLYWLVWARTDVQPDWHFFTEVAFADFPLSDGDLVPPGSWWQVKIAGENAAGVPATPFSNVVASSNAPA